MCAPVQEQGPVFSNLITEQSELMITVERFEGTLFLKSSRLRYIHTESDVYLVFRGLVGVFFDKINT